MKELEVKEKFCLIALDFLNDSVIEAVFPGIWNFVAYVCASAPVKSSCSL